MNTVDFKEKLERMRSRRDFVKVCLEGQNRILSEGRLYHDIRFDYRVGIFDGTATRETIGFDISAVSHVCRDSGDDDHDPMWYIDVVEGKNYEVKLHREVYLDMYHIFFP